MSSPIDVADRFARFRAVAAMASGAILIGAEAIGGPFFSAGAASAHEAKLIAWAAFVVALLLLLATGGALTMGARVHALVHDDVSRHHHLVATRAGFWVAVALGLGICFVPGLQSLSGAEAAYVVVTLSTAVATITLGVLEARALRNA